MPEGRVGPPISEAEAARIALDLYGLHATARALPGEHDDNFRLATPAGDFVLKVMHPARERDFVDLQCRALRHLAERAPELALPRVRETPSGADLAEARGPDGAARLVFVLSWVPGTLLAEARPHTPELLASLGRLLGRMDAALAGFSHPAARRDFRWDLSHALGVRELLGHVRGAQRRVLLERFLSLYESEVVPALPRLRRGVLHGDANDYNVLVGGARERPRRVVSVVDFGDLHEGLLVAEVAVAAAYAMLGKPDPVAAAAPLVAGYHAALPLEEQELALLYPLIAARLAVSVATSAYRSKLKPHDPYATVSEAPAWECLHRLARIPPRLAHYAFREACGLAPLPRAEGVARFVAACQERAAPVLDSDLRTAATVVFDLSVGSTLLGADPKAAETEALTETLVREMRRAGARVGVGRYGEARLLYVSPLFAASPNPTDERRTIHLGVDLFAEPGTPVHAPLEGVVHALANNASFQDYGPVVILRHATEAGEPFFTLYGHLSEDALSWLSVGQRVERGQPIGRIGAPPGNGDWPPHVHVQLVLDLLELDAAFPGVARASERALWQALSPDPGPLLGIGSERLPAPEPSAEQTLRERRERLGRNLRLSYERPLQILRGFRQYLYDETGRAYLDCYNNVPLVGHSHPRVVAAVQRQVALLNTNTRYLHGAVVRYAARLASLLPEPLRVCYFVSSGSEANELALRLARTHTGREDVVVLEHAYHGHTTTLVDLSPYKFDGPGGGGRRSWVHVAPLPDDYRGRYRRGDPEAGAKYAFHVAEILDSARQRGRPVAAFLCESLPSVAGQIVLPPGYLAAAYRHARAAGAVCIADEVQTGFGRLGSHFWGFETQDAVPDLVVLAKPIGNAFPLAAVVTTPAIAASFDNGMEFFSTFGGNPVACAAGLAVLDVLAEEGLQERARRVGEHLLGGLRRLQAERPLIGDLRGSGMFLGVELVRDPVTLEPATEEAAYLVNRLRERGILTGRDGPFENVLKLRPPLVFGERDADLLLFTLAEVLEEDAAQPDWERRR